MRAIKNWEKCNCNVVNWPQQHVKLLRLIRILAEPDLGNDSKILQGLKSVKSFYRNCSWLISLYSSIKAAAWSHFNIQSCFAWQYFYKKATEANTGLGNRKRNNYLGPFSVNDFLWFLEDGSFFFQGTPRSLVTWCHLVFHRPFHSQNPFNKKRIH